MALSFVDLDDELTFLLGATAAGDDDEGNLLHHQLVTSPLLTYSSLEHHAADFPSRGLLGTSGSERVYFNTNTPSSAVICGVQGSGKSHTVSCILESALIGDSRIGKLPEPLSALVFHFDTQDAGRPCEAAFLSSPAANLNHVALPQVTVLCSPSNVNRRRQAYASQAQVRVEPLCLAETDLTADRMLAIMGCDNLDKMPLYMHTALLIIRNMGVDAFSYQEFKWRIGLESLDAKQTAMIELRLHLLDAFLRPGARQIESYFIAGGLVIVDLTDPFLDALTASVLFDIVLGSFTQWQTACGKLVVLDEAHKYLVNSDSARLNQSISNIIRLQRHLATRIIIATQEPTVVPPTILDLASIIICHRFSSPAWCRHLAQHVSTGSEDWYKEVMALPTGHGLVFSPAAALSTDERGRVVLLGRDHLRLRVRPRLTLDGGASILAVAPIPSLGAPTGTSGSVASQSLPTPPISEAHLPARTSSAVQTLALAPAPVMQVAAARSPISTAGSSPVTRSTPELPPPAGKDNDKGKDKGMSPENIKISLSTISVAKESATYVEEGSVFLAATGGHPSLFDTGISHLSSPAVELSPTVEANLSLESRAASNNDAKDATPAVDDSDEDENDVTDIRRVMELSLQPADAPTFPTPGASGASTRVYVEVHRASQPETDLGKASMGLLVADAIATVTPLTVPKTQTTVNVVPVPSVPSSVAVKAPCQRVVPTRLQRLKEWLEKNSTPGTALKLRNVYFSHNLGVIKDDTVYTGASTGVRWWQMLREAVAYGLIELINTDLSKKQPTVGEEVQMIRLLERGPVEYTNTYTR
ncbi:hypothetical protein DFH08DRAFT_1036677 [Mycena albidolilacea]|uniref:AAA+ ATPase domain-containing protein n=1 Tax=Mycena albidolilacea TaxID=1033008 RepID=A0AAD7EF37_9AGAR|nr:hypothetical protein DFH08DRAFT_1036677 [Mycena albidolilacea]